MEKQLAQVNGEPDLSSIVSKLEKRVGIISEAVWPLMTQVEGSPVAGLRGNYKCEWGASGQVAVEVHCTAFSSETSHGWFPEESL